jgi:hypothetical protein
MFHFGGSFGRCGFVLRYDIPFILWCCSEFGSGPLFFVSSHVWAAILGSDVARGVRIEFPRGEVAF